MKLKLIIFDLDGVLSDSRELHYESLNNALASVNKKYVISREEHLAKYDGLTTTRKLKLLQQEKGLPEHFHDIIWKLKQQATEKCVRQLIHSDKKLQNLFTRLRQDGYKIVVASNSVRDNVRLILHQLDVLHLVDYYWSNSDVQHTKPHGEIYTLAMYWCGVNVTETLIVEDSHTGRTAALNSGAHLCPVRSPTDVTEELIYSYINHIEEKQSYKPKWQGGKMNVLIPCAGLGSRFAAAGYTFPKPLIDVEGKPMIQMVVDNLNIDAKYIFIVQQEHYDKYNLKQLLHLITPNCEIVTVNGLTEGAACTTLLAKELIDNDQPLVLANSDQFVEWNSNEFMYSMTTEEIDGGILTFKATHPRWSFAKLDDRGFVTEVAEKNPISDIATVGIYYWKHGKDYVKYAEQMIANNTRVNNEFYVCPVFNEAIADNKKIRTFHIDKMWGTGTPEDLQVFLNRNKQE
jgi:HAD superfamily hydrolase (TIGR01509 family)